jgi:hypothetical protein
LVNGIERKKWLGKKPRPTTWVKKGAVNKIIIGRGLLNNIIISKGEMGYRYYLYQVTRVLLILIFGTAGFFKLFPQYVSDPDFRAEFRQYTTIPPIHLLGLDPDLYRIGVGLLEIGCFCIMIIANKNEKLQAAVTYVLAVVMAGALYTHFMLNHSAGKMGGAIVTSILVLLRLVSMERVKIKIS